MALLLLFESNEKDARVMVPLHVIRNEGREYEPLNWLAPQYCDDETFP